MNKLFAQVTTPLARVQPARSTPIRLFVRDLVLDASIGVYDYERQSPQRIRINLDLELSETAPVETFVQAVRDLVRDGHIALVETLAERIAERCFASPAVRIAKVRVEKLDVFPDLESVGVEIERLR